jgi:hypothetical protein
MAAAQEPSATVADRRFAGDLAKLICKLRWIGLEDEARALQAAISTLPPEKRDTVSAGPFSTD